MTPFLVAAVCASAATGTAEFHLAASTGRSERPDLQGVGVGVSLGLQPVARLSLEAHTEAFSLGTPAWRLDLRPELRWWLTDPDHPKGSASVAAGVGAGRFEDYLGNTAWHPRVTVTGAVDFPVEPHLAVRVGAGPAFDGSGTVSLRVTAGALFGPSREEPPQQVVVAPPAPEPQVWIPHPVCRWVPRSEVATWARELHPAVALRLAVDAGLDEVAPPPAQGSLLLAARPGDRVTIGGVPAGVAADGLALVTAPEGPLAVEVVGGGRRWSDTLAVGSGYAGYVRVPDPPTVEVRFGQGSATVAPADAERLRAIAAAAGDWRFEVVGQHSPEGSQVANERLARARAQAVANLLVAAGIPTDRVTWSISAAEAPAGSPEALRRALVRAMPAGAAR